MLPINGNSCIYTCSKKLFLLAVFNSVSKLQFMASAYKE